MTQTLRLQTAVAFLEAQRTHLNPILEEDSDSGQISMRGSGLYVNSAVLSPVSDHFPTPRGIHFLSAPILPSSPSTVSADSSVMTGSNSWNRDSVATDNTEFEDLYDVSDDDMPQNLRGSRSKFQCQALPPKPPKSVIIPENQNEWSPVDKLNEINSPVPLTPSAQLPMSPAQLFFMGQQRALHVPSAPPSLDGSMSSEQLVAMSSPPTPVIGSEDANQEAWTGIQLQPRAIATLHSLSADEPFETTQREMQMQELPPRIMTSFQSQIQPAPSAARQSLSDLSKLDIPSPGGFFSNLSPRTRKTWHPPTPSPAGIPPPTSTTAEQFYRCPWNAEPEIPPVPSRPNSAEGFYRNSGPSPEPMRQTIKDEDDMPSTRTTPILPSQEDAPVEIIVDHDGNYARKQREAALSNLGRTELWLLAQQAYMRGVEPASALPVSDQEESKVSASREKNVRFSRVLPMAQPKKPLLRQESAYYRAFQDHVVRIQRGDVFVQQLPRFEALQGQRVCLREAHVNQLLGKYQLSVVPQSAKKRLSANVVRGDLNLTDNPEKIKRDKELEAMNQLCMSSWHVSALRFLNGGRLICAPIARRLEKSMAREQDATRRDRARILDLGGQATGDWAWYCALQYPKAKVYTVTTKTIRQLSNANVRGPPNHRQVAVQKLGHLPFPDNHFDVISARELHSILKFDGENGEDEWETCTRECMRILKPGGYLEFSILDSDIMNAGPLGLAKSVEFGFCLKTLGYDPSPSRLWLRRLARAGFAETHRAWICLPMGAKRGPYKNSEATDDDTARVQQTEAVTMGSTDNIAGVCSIIGGWSWERWLLRCEMEKVAGELRLADTVTAGESMREAAKCLEGVSDVMEEGRKYCAGFRMLNGYARKPESA